MKNNTSIQKKKLLFGFEIIWWLITVLVVAAVLWPIFQQTGYQYPFYGLNILFIITFITFTRWIFLLEHTFLANREYLKIAIVLLTPILIFILVDYLNHFLTWLDENGIETFFTNKTVREQESMRKYITSEMLLFGVASVVAVFMLAFRLIVSIWKARNSKQG